MWSQQLSRRVPNKIHHLRIKVSIFHMPYACPGAAASLCQRPWSLNDHQSASMMPSSRSKGVPGLHALTKAFCSMVGFIVIRPGRRRSWSSFEIPGAECKVGKLLIQSEHQLLIYVDPYNSILQYVTTYMTCPSCPLLFFHKFSVVPKHADRRGAKLQDVAIVQLHRLPR